MRGAEEIGRCVPTTLAWNRVLADTPDVVLLAPRLHVYRSLFRVAVAGRLRAAASAEATERFAGTGVRGGAYEPTVTDLTRGLRLGVRFADGRRAVLERHRFPAPLEPASLLAMGRTSSDASAFDWEVVVTAIPSAGPVELYSQWLDLGIGESRAEIDGEALRDAADRSIELWPATRRETDSPSNH